MDNLHDIVEIEDAAGYKVQIEKRYENSFPTLDTIATLFIINTLMTNRKEQFRVSVIGAGCSGFQYSFALEDYKKFNKDEDIVFSANPFSVIDKISLRYMPGSTIKLLNDVFERKLYVDNPLTKSSCGCGESFNIDDNLFRD